MHRLSKSKLYERYNTERHLVDAIRDKLGALANAQLKQDLPIGKNKNKKGNEYAETKRKRTKPKSIAYLKAEIHLFLASVNIHPHKNEKYIPLANREESWLIRFDWDGSFRRPADEDYSEAYARARQIAGENTNRQNPSPQLQYMASDYQLELSPAWRFMKHFQNYAANRRRICRQLAAQNIPPRTVAQMNFFDFSEVMYNWSKANRVHPFESARSRNFKMFEAVYGDDFARVMTLLHYTPQYISQTREKMRRGSCDELLNFHHKTNVSHYKELNDGSKINEFSNMLLTFVQPHHRALHFGNGYDVNPELVFFGGYDPLYQIKRDPERERLYQQGKLRPAAKNAQYSR